MEGDVQHGKDWLLGEGVFYGEEGVLTGGGPIQMGVFLGEVMEGVGDVGEVGDEPLVEVAEANK
jgi:hypothetical protein